jgi:hypothetical protein
LPKPYRKSDLARMVRTALARGEETDAGATDLAAPDAAE